MIVGVHEGGHFYTARLFKVPCSHFAVGMGPVLLSYQGKQTKYEIRAFPIGGFVRMVGDADITSTTSEGNSNPLHFNNRNKFVKSCIIAAGPLANFAFAILIFTLLFNLFDHRQVSPRIGSVVEGGAAEEVGMKPGDLITHINGRQIYTMDDVSQRVSVALDETLYITVLRNDDLELEFDVTPKIAKVENIIGEMISVGRIGIKATELKYAKLPLNEAFSAAVREFKTQSSILFIALRQIITGKRTVEDLSGPVGLAEISGKALSISILTFFTIVGSISINLGIMNLIPFPGLDGYHLMKFFLSTISGGRSFPPRVERFALLTSVVILLGLMLYVSFFDLISVYERHWIGND